jgi:hypothetical protein
LVIAMTTTDKNARAAWATLTHDSLDKAKTGSSTLSKTQFVAVNFALLLGNVLVLFNTGAFASVSLHATGALGVSPPATPAGSRVIISSVWHWLCRSVPGLPTASAKFDCICGR